MSVAISNLSCIGKEVRILLFIGRLRDISVTPFPYLMLTSTVMPKEPAWNLPSRMTGRTRDVTFIQRVIRSTVNLR